MYVFCLYNVIMTYMYANVCKRAFIQAWVKKYLQRFFPSGFVLFWWQMGRDLDTEANNKCQNL